MMDTVLNLSLVGWLRDGSAATGNLRFGNDAFHHFVGMSARSSSRNRPGEGRGPARGEDQEVGAHLDTDLSAEDLQDVVARFKAIVLKETRGCPDRSLRAAQLAVLAVSRSSTTTPSPAQLAPRISRTPSAPGRR